MLEEQRINPSHPSARQFLRVVGPLTVATGLLLTLIGLGSFFASFGSFEPPRYFWCAVVGLPQIGVGGTMCHFAFLGAIVRYQAGEVAPVGRDTFNYLADGTRDGVRTMAAAASAGVADGLRGNAAALRCPQCNHIVDADARFCDDCGAPLATLCAACGTRNDADAKYCDDCGSKLEA